MKKFAMSIALTTILAAMAVGGAEQAQTPKTDTLRAPALSPLMPDPEGPEPTADPGTALYYAQLCARYLGPIPALSCSEAKIVPITVDGVEVFDEPKTCDRPAALTGAASLATQSVVSRARTTTGVNDYKTG